MPGTQLSARRSAGIRGREELIAISLSVCIVLLSAGSYQRRAPPHRCRSRIIYACKMAHDESWKQLREKMHQVNRRLAAARIDAARARLTEHERLALSAKFDSGLSYEEIATRLGERSPEEARAAVLRALNRFAKELDR